MTKEAHLVPEKLKIRSSTNKKNPGKVPKKIHKAEREKLKRENLNELFIELGHALEPARQNNGKASILGDAARILRDLLAQMECLKKENAALLTESHYVTIETNELRDETIVLETEIGKLHHELHERMQSGPAWSNGRDVAPSLMQNANPAASLPEDQRTLPVVDPVFQPQPIVGPVLVIPLHHELPSQAPPKPSSHVSRPQARYPTPLDSWPLKLLNQELSKTSQEEGQISGSTSTSNSGEEGSVDREVSHGMVDNEE
ncbi:transcription factor BHLH062-like [Tasmannia lanceolata]|uniref:transcription factor BHLH062-like n=1 Tax=Tasmannia lanceolata TaxID=3420 RepID=UPI0040641DF0